MPTGGQCDRSGHVRRYGAPPYIVVVLHGGPGAVGEMEPVARELATRCGVLEPLLAALSVDGQVAELRAGLGSHWKTRLLRATTPPWRGSARY
jgi:hypothetical protein